MKKLSFLTVLLLFILVMCKTTEEDKDKKVTTTSTTIASEVTTTTVVTTTTTTTVELYDKNSKIDKRMQFTIDRDKISEDDLKKHMNNLFSAIEEKIATGDFDGWYNALTKDYKYYLNDPRTLKKMSEDSDFLSNRNIKLSSPKDFFQYVVIEARRGKSLKFYDYKYVDKFNVKVICLLDESLKFTYNFKYEDDSWKLDR